VRIHAKYQRRKLFDTAKPNSAKQGAIRPASAKVKLCGIDAKRTGNGSNFGYTNDLKEDEEITQSRTQLTGESLETSNSSIL